MNKEKEIKILEIDKDLVINKLESLWICKVFDDKMEAWYFDVDKKNDTFLRIRTRWEVTECTYKKIQKWTIQSNDEIELHISDAQAMCDILKIVWFEQYQTRVKHRISYKDDIFTYDLDKYPNFPWFMEIEWPDENAIRQQIKILWLEGYPSTSLWYSDFVKDYEWIIASLTSK